MGAYGAKSRLRRGLMRAGGLDPAVVAMIAAGWTAAAATVAALDTCVRAIRDALGDAWADAVVWLPCGTSLGDSRYIVNLGGTLATQQTYTGFGVADWDNADGLLADSLAKGLETPAISRTSIAWSAVFYYSSEGALNTRYIGLEPGAESDDLETYSRAPGLNVRSFTGGGFVLEDTTAATRRNGYTVTDDSGDGAVFPNGTKKAPSNRNNALAKTLATGKVQCFYNQTSAPNIRHRGYVSVAALLPDDAMSALFSAIDTFQAALGRT